MRIFYLFGEEEGSGESVSGYSKMLVALLIVEMSLWS